MSKNCERFSSSIYSSSIHLILENSEPIFKYFLTELARTTILDLNAIKISPRITLRVWTEGFNNVESDFGWFLIIFESDIVVKCFFEIENQWA